jgi:hypothetical protein
MLPLNQSNFRMHIPTPSPFPVFDNVPEHLRRNQNSDATIPLISVFTSTGQRQIFYDEVTDDFYYFDTKELVPQENRKGFQTTIFRRKCMEVTITYSKPRHFKNGVEVESLD